MRSVFIFICLLFIAKGTICQTVFSPKFVKSSMDNHTLDRLDVTNSETILYFSFTAKPSSQATNVYGAFNLHKSTILKTNTGQVVSLLRCENLTFGTQDKDLAYWSSSKDAVTYWKAVFPRIDDNATTLDFDENLGRTGSYFIWGIQLERTKSISKYKEETPEIQKQPSLNVNPIIIEQPKKLVIEPTVSDVDVNIPFETNANSNRFALIIGNEDYHSHQAGLRAEADVEFAAHDATTFKEYAIKVLGVPEDNMIFITNAKLVEMNRSVEKLSLLTKATGGDAEIFFYYAGHGYPDEITKEAYIIPVDVSGADLKYALKLNDIYTSFTAYQSKRVTIFLDACFSGGAREEGLLASRGIKIKPKEPTISGNEVVFCATSSDQSALAYKSKGHGMFTYFLLKKLQETKGDVAYGELHEYLQKQVGVKSILENAKEQTPTVVISPSVMDTWRNWRMK